MKRSPDRTLSCQSLPRRTRSFAWRPLAQRRCAGMRIGAVRRLAGMCIGAARRSAGVCALALLASCFALLASCSAMHDQMTQPAEEPPLQPEDSYLQRGGVSNQLDLGPDQRLLLDEFTALKAAKINLETRMSEIEAANESLRASLRQTEEERDKERRLRAGAEAEVERLSATLHEREAKLLNLSIEKAKLNQDNLLLRIASLQRQLDEIEASAAPPAEGQR
jgi:hypothetical protein